MDTLIEANYIADLKSTVRKDKMFSVVGSSGENIFISGSPRQCETHFEVLCGLRKPDIGDVNICGADPYGMTPHDGAIFRRNTIGAVPQDLGWIPELRMIDQIAFPMKQAGMDAQAILVELRGLTSDLMPLHDLYNSPGRCTARKQAHAAIFRAMIHKPQVLVLNGFLDNLSDVDTEALWHALLAARPQNSILIYLSGAPAPKQVKWTQKLRV